MGDLSLAIKTGVQHGLFGGAITNLGTQYHHETFLPDAITVELPGCFAMTELGHGSDVQSIETTITYDPDTDEYIIDSPTESATKAYIGSAARDGRMAVVFGQLWVGSEHHGVHVALVPIRDADGNDLPGVTTGDHGLKGGLLGIDNGTIRFDQVRVPRRMLLDKYGGVDDQGNYHSPIKSKNARFFTMLGTLVRGRVCVGGGAASAARRALTIAVQYANQRSQFRKPGLGEEIVLMDYLSHQRRLLPDVARAYAYGYAQNELALQLERIMTADGADPVAARELETRAAGMKALLTRWANDTVQQSRSLRRRRLHGRQRAYPHPAGRRHLRHLRRRQHRTAATGGQGRCWTTRPAGRWTARHRPEDRPDDGWHLHGTHHRALGDRPLVAAARMPESQQLRARGWHVEMFEFRESHIVEGLAQRMRAASKAEDSFAAINACQPHMLEAARAHIDRVVLEAFIEGIEECQDEYVTALLAKVCDLYALATIEANRAWYLEHEVFGTWRSKSIIAEVDLLCGELRPYSLALVEGLGVPQDWLVHPRAAIPPLVSGAASGRGEPAEELLAVS